MSGSVALDRLMAWKEGKPLPMGQALPWPRAPDEDRLVMAFVRMAGESGPWGAAFGTPGKKPTVLTVAEPRNADELAKLGLALWDGLRPHVPHPDEVEFAEGLDEEEKLEHLQTLVRHRQLWLPGSSHVSMLHFLDYRYTPAKLGEPDDVKQLNALGRACGWLFRESTRPGQVRVFDATRRLRSTFAFPAETPRQQHLGFLLGWLNATGSRAERLAAAHEREDESVAITMDPDLERDQLQPLLQKYNDAKGDPAAMKGIAAKIDAVLQPELVRRFQLTVEALATFDHDGRPPNANLAAITDLGVDEFVYQYWRREAKAAATVDESDAPRFVGNHPETDFHPSAAASRFFSHMHASELTLSELIHGDPDLIEEAITSGDAIRGTITKVVDEGPGRKMTPVWTVVSDTDAPMRIREDSSICVAGLRGREGTVRSIDVDRGQRVLVIEITGWKNARPDENAPAAIDEEALEGTEVILLAAGVVGISLNKSFKVWDGSGPGAWLTHAAPAPEPGPRRPRSDDLIKLVQKLGGR